jgi:hypothetical protein
MGGDYFTPYHAQFAPADLERALAYYPVDPLIGGGGASSFPPDLAAARDAVYKFGYQRWLARNKGAEKTPWESWRSNYMKWLKSGGAKYAQTPASTVTTETPAGVDATSYLTDEGYRSAGELLPDDTVARYIKMKQDAALADTGTVEPYWETSYNTTTTPAGWAQAGSVLPAGWNQRPGRNVTINFGGGAGNRVGARASTQAKGQVSRTPAGVYYSDMTSRAREKAGKKWGRMVSGQGVTAVPSLQRLSRYRRMYT